MRGLQHGEHLDDLSIRGLKHNVFSGFTGRFKYEDYNTEQQLEQFGERIKTQKRWSSI